MFRARSIVEKGAGARALSEPFNDAPADGPAFIIISVLLIMTEPRKLHLCNYPRRYYARGPASGMLLVVDVP